MAANLVVLILGAGPRIGASSLRNLPVTATRLLLPLGVGVAPRPPKGFSLSKRTLPSPTRSHPLHSTLDRLLETQPYLSVEGQTGQVSCPSKRVKKLVIQCMWCNDEKISGARMLRSLTRIAGLIERSAGSIYHSTGVLGSASDSNLPSQKSATSWPDSYRNSTGSNCDELNEPIHHYSVTSAPKQVPVRLHEAWSEIGLGLGESW